MKRRDFIKTGTIGAAVLATPLASRFLMAADKGPQVVVVTSGEPQALVQKGITALGGMERFIAKGDVVVIKPNMGWDRSPELAANTNPEVVAELVTLCLAAGAKEVKVFDRTCNNPRRCYRNSKIEEAAKAAGAKVTQVRNNKFKDIPIGGTLLKEWPVYSEYMEADKVINVPVAKHHGMSGVTLGLKNLMGVMGGDRGSLHNHFAQKMAEINRHLLPTLTVIDGYRMLTANGPQGGNPDHVKLTRTLIASPFTVSAVVTALELFSLNLNDVPYIKTAAEQGLARFDINNLNIRRITA